MQDLHEVLNDPKIPPTVSGNENADSLFEVTRRLPQNSHLILHERTWEDYENLIATVGESGGLRISFDNETLHIMTLSSEHENYARLIQMLIGILSLRLDIDIESFGSATIIKAASATGTEPDACFYVQSVETIGTRINLDFSFDPPPDIVVEIDIHHDSRYKLPIYLSLGVPEIWRYDRESFEIYKLESGEYIRIENSAALPVLNARILGDLLNRSRSEKQTKILKEFEDWLKSVRRQ